MQRRGQNQGRTAAGLGRLVRQSFAAMTAQERARLIAMYGVIAGLHVAGFPILRALEVPSHSGQCRDELVPHP